MIPYQGTEWFLDYSKVNMLPLGDIPSDSEWLHVRVVNSNIDWVDLGLILDSSSRTRKLQSIPCNVFFYAVDIERIPEKHQDDDDLRDIRLIQANNSNSGSFIHIIYTIIPILTKSHVSSYPYVL